MTVTDKCRGDSRICDQRVCAAEGSAGRIELAERAKNTPNTCACTIVKCGFQADISLAWAYRVRDPMSIDVIHFVAPARAPPVVGYRNLRNPELVYVQARLNSLAGTTLDENYPHRERRNTQFFLHATDVKFVKISYKSSYKPN